MGTRTNQRIDPASSSTPKTTSFLWFERGHRAGRPSRKGEGGGSGGGRPTSQTERNGMVNHRRGLGRIINNTHASCHLPSLHLSLLSLTSLTPLVSPSLPLRVSVSSLPQSVSTPTSTAPPPAPLPLSRAHLSSPLCFSRPPLPPHRSPFGTSSSGPLPAANPPGMPFPSVPFLLRETGHHQTLLQAGCVRI